jgi:AraC-like DNA-binding protein
MDKERMLLAALRRGDSEAGRKILNELLAILFFANPDHFKFVQYRAIELVVLLSRAAMAPGSAGLQSDDLRSPDSRDLDLRSSEDAMLETNNRYLRRIQEAKSIEELTDVLHIIVERMSGQIFSFQGVRHASALRKAERFIWENYTRKISLQEIASASGLSAPYFSTIFKEEMGENLSSYLNRLRVEKASHMLMETDLSLNEIASSCGFEDQSWFSKIFKSFTSVSPGKYRGQGGGAIGIAGNAAADTNGEEP